MAEVRLPKHLSIEADGIYRPLNFRNLGRFVRIPVLPSAEAFAEVGPSFRLASNRNDTRPSDRGATGGLGMETILGPLSVSLALRYTRWAGSAG